MTDEAPRSLHKAASEPDFTALPIPSPIELEYLPTPPTPPPLLIPQPSPSPPSLSPRSSPRSSPRPRPAASPTFSQTAPETVSFSEYVASELAQGQSTYGVRFAPAASATEKSNEEGPHPDGLSSTAHVASEEETDPAEPVPHPSPKLRELPFDTLPPYTDVGTDKMFPISSMSRYGKLACLELDAKGLITPREMSRADILQEARDTLSKSQPSPKAIGRWLSNAGDVQSPSPELKEFARRFEGGGGGRKATQKALRDYLRNSLQARDIRQVDPAFVAKPALWVRHAALVVSLEGLRAIILRHKMFLFDPENERTKQLAFIAKQSVLARPDAENLQPFEFKALEGILIYLAMGLEREFAGLKPAIEEYLTELPNELTTKMLEKLRLLKQQLNHFHARASSVKTILENLLDDDDEMANMYLTKKHMWHIYDGGNAVDHSEIETMLEAYLQVIDEHVNHATLLNDAIDDTEDLVMIHLDTLRNRLLSVELALSVVSMTFGIGGVVAGLFGMNIQIPQFQQSASSLWFPLVAAAIVVLVFGVALLALIALRRRGLYSFY